MSENGEIIDSTATEVGTALEPSPAAPPASLFRTDDPVEILQQAEKIANALAPVIRKAGLVSNISGKDYLKVEAWQTLGQQVGVTPVITSTTRIDKGWEARCEARTLDGRTIGAADSMCTTEEERWKDSADFEVRSMAQTRAMSRALASVLRFIPTLAGMGGTPAEEMDRVAARSGGSRKGFASDKQRFLFERLLKETGVDEQGVAAICDFARSTMSGGRDQGISKAIDGLKDKNRCAEFVERLTKAATDFAQKITDEAENIPVETHSGDEDIPF